MAVSKEKQRETELKTMKMLADRGIELTVDDAWGWIKGRVCLTPWCDRIIKQWNKRKLTRWYFDWYKDMPGATKYRWGHLTVCDVCTSMIWFEKEREARKKKDIAAGVLH